MSIYNESYKSSMVALLGQIKDLRNENAKLQAALDVACRLLGKSPEDLVILEGTPKEAAQQMPNTELEQQYLQQDLEELTDEQKNYYYQAQLEEQQAHYLEYEQL